MLYLPGFKRTSSFSKTDTTLLTVEGSSAKYFNATWNPIKSLLYLTALYKVPLIISYEIIIINSNGFVMPSEGINSQSSIYSISLKKGDMQITNEVIKSVSVIPVVEYSAISFISSDWTRSYEYGGEMHVIQLEAGHEFSILDAGAQIVIGGIFYTIDKLDENLLYLVEPYIGVNIFLGYPNVAIYSPPFRFAYYLSGSGTQYLLFRYKVRRGDFSSSLGIYNPATTIYNASHQSLELYGGKLLRLSDNPSIAVSTVISSYNLDSLRGVNSDAPVITALTSTSIGGIYSVGQKIDFQVRFSHTVFVGEFSIPILLLRVEPFGRVNAYYESGNSTDTIVFVYTVSYEDLQLNINDTILTTQSPIFQPLRPITTNVFNFLRRFSTEPIVDVDVKFSNDTVINIPHDLNLIGKSSKVIGIELLRNSRDNVYTSGDIIFIHVSFSDDVSVITNNQSSLLISLNFKSVKGSLASFYAMYNSSTLIFSYRVTIHDVAANGLFLSCTCLDYFQRTFIHLNESKIVTRFSNISVSILLANSSSESDLLISNDFRIDNSDPYITAIVSNISATSSNILSPGDVVLISVTYSQLVTVTGIIRLILKGESTNCPARFYGGNNSNIIQFIYVVSYQSGVAKLDCTNVDSVDVSRGTIYRLSDNPSIVANSILPRPGVETSLGIQANIIIDTSPILITSVGVYDVNILNLPYLPISDISFNIYGNSSDLFRSSSDQSFDFVDPRFSLNSSIYNTLHEFESAIKLSSSSWSIYDRISISDKYNDAFRFVSLWNYIFPFPQIGFQSYWWTALNTQSQLEIEVSFDRGVVYNDDISLELNTGQWLNKAFSRTQGHTYFLEVSQLAKESTYRIEYGGKQTLCISTSASSKGFNSIQIALESVNSIKILLPNVQLVLSTGNILKYQITFVYLPLYDFQVLSDNILGQSCYEPVKEGQILIYKDKNTATFVYDILSSNSIVLSTLRDLLPGNYSVHIGPENGILVDQLGISSRSVWFNRYRKSYKIISKSTLLNSVVIPNVLKSSLSFESNKPQSPTIVYLTICLGSNIMRNDIFKVL